MKKLSASALYVLCPLLLILSSCSNCPPGVSERSSIATFDVSECLSVDVKKMEVSNDSYNIVVALRERTSFRTIIQEVQTSTGDGYRYSIVESFDTKDIKRTPGGKKYSDQRSDWDNHWSKGAVGWEKRHYTFYAGEVVGADKTWVGFAILKENIDGSIKTQIMPNVNSMHTTHYQIAGKVSQRHHETGTYEISWIPNRLVLSTNAGEVVLETGQTPQVTIR